MPPNPPNHSAYMQESIARKQDRLTDLLIDESITKDIYNNKLSGLINRQQEINQQLEHHHKGNEQFKIALSSLIALASHAYDIFASSTIDEKRQMLGYVFSNLELEGATLRFSLRKPFDLFADLATCQEWLPLVEQYRTVCFMPNPQAQYAFEAVSST